MCFFPITSCSVPSLDDEWPPLRPLSQRALPDFPVEIFPAWLERFVDAVATSKQVSVALPAMLSLAAVATALQSKFVVEVKRDYREPLQLYIVVALPSGDRKTATLAEIRRPVDDFEREQACQHVQGSREIETRRSVLIQAIRSHTSAAARETNPLDPNVLAPIDELKRQLADLPLPTAPTMLANDATVEALAQIMERNGGRAAILADEAAILGRILGGSGKDESTALDLLLQAYSSSPFRADRVTRAPVTIASPALTLGIATQPDVLENLIGRRRLHERGLLARILFAIPKSMIGARYSTAPPAPSSVVREYAACVRRLLQLQSPAPAIIELSDDARSCWHDFSDRIESRLRPNGDLRAISAWVAKLPGNVARIAGLLHALHEVPIVPKVQPLPLARMEGAVKLGGYLLEQARAAFEGGSLDPNRRVAERLLEIIEADRLTEFRARDLFQRAKGTLRTMSQFAPVLALLEEQGFIRERPAPAARGRGRPSVVFDVNPAVHAQNSQNSEEATAFNIFEDMEHWLAREPQPRDEDDTYCCPA